MPKVPLRIAIVDDHQLVRLGLAAMLAGWSEAQVVVSAANGLEYEKACAEVGHIHVALVDHCMPLRSGPATLQWMDKNQKRTLALSMCIDPTPEITSTSLHLGARGMFCKSIGQDELRRTIVQAHNNGFAYNQFVDRALRTKVQTDQERIAKQKVKLAPRQLEFFLHYTSSPYPSLKAVAVLMDLELSGVETHRKDVVKRTGCHTREEMMQWRWEGGLGVE